MYTVQPESGGITPDLQVGDRSLYLLAPTPMTIAVFWMNLV